MCSAGYEARLLPSLHPAAGVWGFGLNTGVKQNWCGPRSTAYELGDFSEAVKQMSPGVTTCEVGIREPTSLSPRAD